MIKKIFEEFEKEEEIYRDLKNPEKKKFEFVITFIEWNQLKSSLKKEFEELKGTFRKSSIKTDDIKKKEVKNMEIITLKNFRDVLDKIPADILDKFSIGFNEDGECNLGCSEGDTEVDMMENYEKYFKRYKELEEIKKYFTNLQKEIENKEESDSYPISSGD